MTEPDLTGTDADELESVLAQLRSGGNLFATSERAARIGHFEWDRKRDCLASCSDEYARIFGLAPDEIIGAQNSRGKLLEWIHPDDRGSYLESTQAASQRKHLDIEYRIRLDSGEIRHLREIGVYLGQGKQQLKGDFGLVQDITHSVQQRSELEQRNDLADQAENLFAIGHYIYDEENDCYLYLSEGFARIHGTTVEEYMTRAQTYEGDLEEIVAADRERVDQAYEHYHETGEPLEIEYRITRTDGEQRWVRELNEARSMRNGLVQHTLGALQDITRQKEIEIELRYKDSLASQAEIITDIGHFVFDEITDKFVYVSPGLARIYGVDSEFLLNKLQSTAQDLEFVHEDDREAVAALYNEEIESDESGYDNWEIEYRMVRPTGEVRWVREIGKTQVIEADIEEQTIGVMIDITAQKNAEQEIREARDNLEQQVLERTRELASTVEQLETEIAERKRMAAELQFLANHDALTGMPSLRLGRDRVQQALAIARRSQQLVAVMFLDLDGFKQINDKHGHEAGDQVLKVVAGRLKAEVREHDTVARIGGDEFLMVLSDIPDVAVVERVATDLLKSVAQKIRLENTRVEVGISIGIALFPDNASSVDALINAADKAMYQVKSRGKNDYGFAGLKSGRRIIDPEAQE